MQIKVLSLAVAAVGGLLFSAATQAEHEEARSTRSDIQYARVIDAEPIVRVVRVQEPVRECYEKEVEYHAYRDHHDRGPARIIGGVLGGIAGSQFGGGRHGRHAAILAGTLLGSAIASESARKDKVTRVISRPETVCETHYQTREEERIDGYRVRYEYNGRVYSTRMRNEPGARIPVRVTVRPAGYRS